GRDMDRLLTALERAFATQPRARSPRIDSAPGGGGSGAQQGPPVAYSPAWVPQPVFQQSSSVPLSPRRPATGSHRRPAGPLLAGVSMLLVVAALGVLLNGHALGGLFGARSTGTGTGTGTGTSTGTSAGITNGKSCKHIAFLLPESATAARWEAADHPDVVAAIQQDLPGATVDAPNAQGSAAAQQTQARSELNQGACILVVAAVDALAAATIVTEARAKNVPV